MYRIFNSDMRQTSILISNVLQKINFKKISFFIIKNYKYNQIVSQYLKVRTFKTKNTDVYKRQILYGLTNLCIFRHEIMLKTGMFVCVKKKMNT